ncbi:MIR motif-containing protein [Gilbertella persicaria]|uniref:MIR motif-containing protein n=1 Tax=Gilbertella persicaria TaxID=101096 RepID=UPI00222015FD|nr:MIR motif-containing protein [Gilbertella persicaria]KAI8095087.1 MIR motif-containing protein [Gilbertella persicaria]
MSRPQEDGIVRFGNHISLKHVTTGRYLTSREGENYEGGSGQQLTFTADGIQGEESTWIVIPPVITEEEAGYEVGFEDKVRLKHVPTRSNLHSHGIESPVTGQQEVSCFGDDENSDENDIWEILQYDEDDERYDDFWRVDQPVVLRHVETGRFLHSHPVSLSNGENEVTGFEGTDENNQWAVSFD